MLHLPSAAGFDGESEPAMDVRGRHPAALHTSRSTPGLSQQLKARISSSLLHNPTVIHRPKLNSRPTVLNGNLVSGHHVKHKAHVHLLTLPYFVNTAVRVCK